MSSEAFDTTTTVHGFTFPSQEEIDAFNASFLKAINGKKKKNVKSNGKQPNVQETKGPISLSHRCGGTARKRTKKEFKGKVPRDFASINEFKFLLDTLGVTMGTLAKVWRKEFQRNLTGKCKRKGCKNVISAGCPMFIRSITQKRGAHVYHDVPHVFFLFTTTNGHDLTTDEGRSTFRVFLSSLSRNKLSTMIQPVCHICYDESLRSAMHYSMEAFLDITENPVQPTNVSKDEYIDSWCLKSKLCQFRLPSGHRCCEPVSSGEIHCLSCTMNMIAL